MTEDALIEALRQLVGDPRPPRVLVGIGDDAAVWQPSRSARCVITTDALVEDVHFRRRTMSLRDVGWRAMAANLSDVAAMGARPLLCTVALGIPPDSDDEDVVGLYRGMLAAASAGGCAIAGGDLTRAPALTLALTMVGEVRPSNLKTRSGARPGDVLAVTGALGAGRAGLDVLEGAGALSGQLREEALQAHRRPPFRIAEGRWLGASAHVHAMMDISDGLSTDLARLCASSGCAAIIDGVPSAPSAVAMARARNEDPQQYALAAGEDFELLVAIAPRAFAHLARRFRPRFRRELIAVGRCTAGSGVTRRTPHGNEPLAPTGWDHFR